MGRTKINTFLKDDVQMANRHENSTSLRNANQKHNELSPHKSEWLVSKRKLTKSRDKEKREPKDTVDGNVNRWAATMESSMETS